MVWAHLQSLNISSWTMQTLFHDRTGFNQRGCDGPCKVSSIKCRWWRLLMLSHAELQLFLLIQEEILWSRQPIRSIDCPTLCGIHENKDSLFNPRRLSVCVGASLNWFDLPLLKEKDVLVHCEDSRQMENRRQETIYHLWADVLTCMQH